MVREPESARRVPPNREPPDRREPLRPVVAGAAFDRYGRGLNSIPTVVMEEFPDIDRELLGKFASFDPELGGHHSRTGRSGRTPATTSRARRSGPS